MRIDEITSWEAFLAVAKHGNFSRASKALNVGVPQVSKRVAKLEAGLNTRLFQRSTRSVSLTSEGQALLPKVISIMEDLESLENQFIKTKDISGTIKMTCPPFLAHRFLAPLITKFTKENPLIKIELDLSKKFVNLIESGIDLALRIETPKDSELIYRKMAPNNLIFCATPKYIKENSKLQEPEDLKVHNLLALSIHNKCKFKKTNTKLGNFKSSKKIVCEDDVLLKGLALEHSGILLKSIYDVQNEINEGKLIQVLKKHPLEVFGHIYAVIPSKRYLAPRVRSFLDYILESSKTTLE